MTSLVVLSALVAAMVSGGGEPDVPAAPARVEVVTQAPDAASAMVAARRQGRRVEVVADRTDTRTVFANPDGTHTAQLTATPMRVSRAGKWVPIDTTLVRTSDGTVVAKAAAAAVLSGGGSGPLVRFSAGPHELALHWPGRLPTPVLDRNTATYREVRPGVDLRMVATAHGIQQLLVLKKPGAEAGAVLRVDATGVRLSAAGDGALSAVDAAGKQVFGSPPSVMWDSRDTPLSAPVGVGVANGVVTVTPDQDFLTDPATKYPVYVDPTVTGIYQSAWGTVLSGKPTTTYWRTSADPVHPDWAQVGQCYNSQNNCGGIAEAWAYFQFETAFLGDKDVLSAKFFSTVAHSPGCGSNTHQLNVVHAPLRTDLKWNNKPEGPLAVEFGAPDACGGPHGVELDVMGKLNGLAPTTFYLHARDRLEQNAWRKYVTADTRVEVRWNRPPLTPRNLRTDPPLRAPCRWCDGKSYVANQTISFIATLDDPDSDGVFPRWRVSADFVQDVIEPPNCPQCQTKPSGGSHNLTYNLVGKNGKEMRWWVHADDGVRASGPAHGPQLFVVDHTPPKAAPAVTSAVYPNDVDGWFGGPGVPDVFTFGPGGGCDAQNTLGTCDIDNYLYDWNNAEPATKIDATALGGGASVTLAPPTYGRQTLYVKSVDRAGHRSPLTTYTFDVRDTTGPRGHWPFEANLTDTAYVGGRHGTAHGAVSYTDGAVGTAVALTGNAYVSAPNPLRTDASFTVSAWVRPAGKPAGVMAAVSQEGAENSGWYLDYRGAENKWSFMMTSATGAPEARYVVSKEPPTVGEWTHLAGVYDRPTHTIRLYVNGIAAGSLALPATITPWRADGALNVGREKWQGQFANYWQGSVDEVQTYDRVLTDTEIRALVSRDDVRTGHWRFDDAPEVDGLRNTVAANEVTRGSAVTLMRGARFAGGAVELDGVDDMTVTDGPVVRTDQSFTVSAWVTVPAFPADTRSMAALSQDSPGNSGFVIEWNGVIKKWVFLRWDSQTEVTGPMWRGAAASQAPVAGAPTLLTGVYDGVTRELRFYVNGEFGASAILERPAWHAAGPLVVGRSRDNTGGDGSFWRGTVDDVRTYNRVLAPEEIQTLVTKADKPTGSWRLDGDTTDAAGTRHGTWAGTPQWTSGHSVDPDPADQAVRLTGTNAVSAPRAVTTTESYTVAAWVKLDAATGCHCTILSQDAQHTSGFALEVGYEGRWSMFASSGDNAAASPNGSWAIIGAARTAQAGVWTHIAGVHNKKRGQLELYVNGALVQTVAFTNPINATGELQIGRGQWYEYPGHVKNFAGAIDDVRVYSRPLYADEIRVLAGRDLSLVHSWQLNDTAVDSVGARTATLQGGAAYGPGRAGPAVRLDGVDDAVSTTGVDVRTDQSFTVTSWVKLTRPGECAQDACVRTAVSLDGGQGLSKFRLGHLKDRQQAQGPGKWIFELPERDGTVTRAAISVNPSLFDTWVLLAGVYDAASGQLELYVFSDDPLAGVDRETGLLGTPWQGTGALQIGRAMTDGTAGQHWPGSVDDVRIHTGNLSAARLAALHASYPAVTQ